MPRVSQDHLDARRRQILDGARLCFSRYGYEGATVRRLEEATGLSRGAIFHHFKDKESLFLALAADDAERMADVVAEHGLVQVMRDLLAASSPRDGTASTAAGSSAESFDNKNTVEPFDKTNTVEWLGARLEVSRRLRTDVEFRARWAERSAQLSTATRARLRYQADAGKLRDDIDVRVLSAFLELALEGLIAHLAMGLPADDLEPVLDLIEDTVRRQRRR